MKRLFRVRRCNAIEAILLVLFGMPIIAGLAGTLLPAFGHLPAIGHDAFHIAPWMQLFSTPGFASSLRLSVTTGLAAPLLALTLAAGFCAAAHGRMRFRAAGALLAPLLASPHSAMAIGLAFVLAPSGWLARLVTPWLTGWTVPPDFASTGDSFGVALVVGLLVKEVPYLLLAMLAALSQIPVAAHVRAGRSLGYGRGIVWMKIIFPQVYVQIRLPVYVVLAYSLSVVDMALVLAPGNPAPLAVLALRWFMAPDVAQYLPAAAAAMLQLLLVLAAIDLWRCGERGASVIGQAWIARGGRGLASEPGIKLAGALVIGLFALGAASLLGMALWSLTWTWRFPEALPTAWTLSNWTSQMHTLAWPLANSVTLGLATSLTGLVLAIAWFESHDRSHRKTSQLAVQLACLPLLVPQISFMFGVQVPLLWLHLDGSFVAVAWAHLLFVFPYMVIALADPWRALDPRFARCAAALGASPARILLAVKLPVLLRPVLIACAIGFAVSIAQYLPTLFAGNGRMPTLTTEAMTLASGADRRVTGVYALLQSLLPLLAYAGALWLPVLIHGNRRAMPGPA